MQGDLTSTEPVAPPIGWPVGLGATDGDRSALAVLASLRGLSPRNLHRLIWREGGAAQALLAIRAGRAGSPADRTWASRTDGAQVLAGVTGAGARFVTPHDDEFPPGLLQLDDPPAALFVLGRPLADDELRVAVVGSRRCSGLGREIAEGLARHLAGAGACVVSGAAYGIDAASHRGALAGGGRTIAVLGSGIDVWYPRSSAELIARIARSGSVVSEYAPGVPAEPHRFPARNRIVVAFASALVVVEGARGSGTRISVDHALDLGKDIFAIPGPVTSPLSEVPLELIREGATMIRGADDLLADLGYLGARVGPAPPRDLPEHEDRAWRALVEPSVPEAVARAASLSIPDTVGALVRLELRGLVRVVGGRYERRSLEAVADPGV